MLVLFEFIALIWLVCCLLVNVFGAFGLLGNSVALLFWWCLLAIYCSWVLMLLGCGGLINSVGVFVRCCMCLR